jgi:hypothetical protein
MIAAAPLELLEDGFELAAADDAFEDEIEDALEAPPPDIFGCDTSAPVVQVAIWLETPSDGSP